MPRTYGNCGPVVAARAGIEVPDPHAPRLDFDAIRARVAARAASAMVPDVDRVHWPADAPVPGQLVDQQAAENVEQAGVVVAGPVVCDVCTQVVTAEYVARTGQRRHGPCQGRTTRATRVRAGRRASVRAVA
jgi:hypothetical protein